MSSCARPTSPVFGEAAPAERLTVPSLSIVGRTWRDGDRLYVPRWHSHLSALRPERSEDDWRAFFAYLISEGFNGARAFAGALPWAGQTADGARARLPVYLDLATAYGLAVEVTALTETGTGYDVEQHVREIAAIVRGRANVVLELANEYQHPSQRLEYVELVRLGYKYGGDLRWAVGAPNTDEPTTSGVYPGAGGRYCTAHLDRGRPLWDQCRRVREIFACAEASGVPCVDNEPMGADEVETPGKQRISDPAFFAGLGALDRAFGVGGVHHSQAGLEAVLPGPVQRACAAAYVAGHRAVEDALGGELGSYKNAGWADSPVARFDDRFVREYSCVRPDGTGVIVGIGAPPDVLPEMGAGYQLGAERLRVTAMDGRALVIWAIMR